MICCRSMYAHILWIFVCPSFSITLVGRCLKEYKSSHFCLVPNNWLCLMNYKNSLCRNFGSRKCLLLAPDVHTPQVNWQSLCAQPLWHFPLFFALLHFFADFLSTHSVAVAVRKIGLRNIVEFYKNRESLHVHVTFMFD